MFSDHGYISKVYIWDRSAVVCECQKAFVGKRLNKQRVYRHEILAQNIADEQHILQCVCCLSVFEVNTMVDNADDINFGLLVVS